MRNAGRHDVSLKTVLAAGCLLLVGFSGATSAGERPRNPDLGFSQAAGGGSSQGVAQEGPQGTPWFLASLFLPQVLLGNDRLA